MAIPDYQTCMLPLLRHIGDGAEHNLREATEALVEEFSLADAERLEMLPSGRGLLFNNRVAWARFYLKKAGLLSAPRRGAVMITERGLTCLKEKPQRIDVKYLERFPEFAAFRATSPTSEQSDTNDEPIADRTPREVLEFAHQQIRSTLIEEVLTRVMTCSPMFFETLVVDLLLKMGYGSSRREAGERIGRSGDGGIDGIIKEDRLGLDAIYIQAKRWQGSVGRPEIQKFVGAVQGQRAHKGVFITTSTFTADAKTYADTVPTTRVVLIDGQQLARLMIDFDVGVSLTETFALKRIDSDYFEEAE